MQYGVITVMTTIFSKLLIPSALIGWFVYILVFIFPTVFYIITKETKIAKILF